MKYTWYLYNNHSGYDDEIVGGKFSVLLISLRLVDQ